MAPTPMDIVKMKVQTFHEVLDSKKPTEKKGNVSWAFAEDFNKLLDEAKKAEPAMAEHLPERIKFINSGYGIMTVQHIDYLHIEIRVKQIIGAIRLFSSNS